MLPRLLLLPIAAILLSGCASSAFTPTPTLPPTAESPATLPEPSDPTRLITATVGENMELTLPANPSTGYRWNLVAPLDESVVQLVRQDYIAQQPIAPGSGGMEVWTFHAQGAGDTTIELGYFAPGNPAEPEETIVFSIRVQ